MIDVAVKNAPGPIAKLKKTSKVELWVSIRDFQGKTYVDVREHFLLADDRQWHPTKKGVMVALPFVGEVIAGVEALHGHSDIGTVAVIEKSKRDEIQIAIREFESHRYGELRVWYAEDGEKQPSNKGVTFRLALLDDLLGALRAADKYVGRLQEKE